MNTRKAIGQMRGVAAARDNQLPPQAPDEGVAITVNLAGLADAEVRTPLS